MVLEKSPLVGWSSTSSTRQGRPDAAARRRSPVTASRGARVLVTTGRSVLVVDPEDGTTRAGAELAARASCLAADPWLPGRAWCGTGAGVLRSDDGGASWQSSGLDGERVTAVAASPARRHLVWAGTEPSAVWRSGDGGVTWERADGLLDLPSSSEWSFPPRPTTHHVRWVGCHPADAGRLWVAIEAGALVTSPDGGRSWRDRVPGGPYDTHQLAIHPERPDWLRSAAGDGYFESRDGGATWSSPEAGLDVGYLVSVAIDPGDPEVVVVSAASGPFSAYVAQRADGRIYRREGRGRWRRVLDGWPDPPVTIAPLLAPGVAPGELWAADERGVHRSRDGGRSWEMVGAFDPPPPSLAALALIPAR
jgi:photosystem II stability/assembly factor-like uncharacterized protein